MAFVRGRAKPPHLLFKTDLEWMRIPPLPFRIVLTDRADGTLWYLTFNTDTYSTDGEGYISITDQIPTVAPGDVHVYGPNDGPYIGADPAVRLLVRGGRLGYEDLTFPASTHRVFSRKRVQRDMREIIIPTNHPLNTLAWKVVNANG